MAPADLASFLRRLPRDFPGVTVTGICTHFTGLPGLQPDGPADALAQYALFQEALAALSDDDLAGLTLHRRQLPRNRPAHG